MASVSGISNGKVYGVNSPIYLNVLAGLGEELTSVFIRIRTWRGTKASETTYFPTINDWSYELQRDTNTFGVGAVETEFNVATFARDAIRFDSYDGNYLSLNACWMRVNYTVNFLDNSDLPDSTTGNIYILCSSGYSFYEDGANVELNPVNFRASSLKATIGSTLNIPVISTSQAGSASETASSITATYSDGTTSTQSITTSGNNSDNLLQRFLFSVTDVDWIDVATDNPNLPTLRVYPTKPYKYTPYKIGYLDSQGTVSYVTFFGNSKENANYDRENFRRFRGSKYSTEKGNHNTFYTNGQDSITLNSDWVDEDFYNVIDEILLSEYVFIQDESLNCGVDFFERAEADGATVESKTCAGDAMAELGVSINDTKGEPVYVVSSRTQVLPNTTSVEIFKSLDGLINYSLDFKKAFNKKATFR